MIDEARLEQSVETNEGFRAAPYLDTESKWTWGEGLCLETNPPTGLQWKYLLDNKLVVMSISRAGADWFVQQKLAAIEKQLALDYAEFWLFLGGARQAALVEIAYQMGVNKEETFHVAIQAMREARWHDAEAAFLDSLWARQTPPRATKLAAQIGTGEFQ